MEAPLIAVENEEDKGPKRRTMGARLITVRVDLRFGRMINLSSRDDCLLGWQPDMLTQSMR